MPNYRRSRVEGGTYFFTVNTLSRQKQLLTRHIDALREAFRSVKSRHPYHLDALVILPYHFHMVMTLPQNSEDFSTIIRLTKSEFTKRIKFNSPNANHKSRLNRKEQLVWQRRFWEHQIRGSDDYRRHIDYCYINPVKHGHVKKVIDWPYSTFHRDVKRGLYSLDWGGVGNYDGVFGE
ncbi:transposase [Kangiella japonica]|uniref:Transposase n=1 Tax=Kangiella japonica TaxID=647384 RepID=A0ABP3CPS3_9GAMM